MEEVGGVGEKDGERDSWIEVGKWVVGYIKEEGGLGSVWSVKNLYEVVEEGMEEGEEGRYV